MNNRIKELRSILNISQEELATAIGLSKSGVSNIECGNRKVNDKHIRMLEMTYNVNPDWVRTGEGNMFLLRDTSPLSDLKKKYNLSEIETQLVERYLSLSPSDRNAFTQILLKMTSHND